MPRLLPLPILCTLLLAGCGNSQPVSAPDEGQYKDASVWDLPALDESRRVRLDEYAGQVVVMSFWASWCGPCKRELPALQRLYNTHKKAGLVVIGVNIDDDVSAARKTAHKLGVEYPLVHDTGGRRTARGYPSDMIPTTFVVDRKGKIRARHVGYTARSGAQLEREVRALLNEESTP